MVVLHSISLVNDAEKIRFKRLLKRMGRKKILAETKTIEINHGKPREIKTLKSRKGRDERRDGSVPRGKSSR